MLLSRLAFAAELTDLYTRLEGEVDFGEFLAARSIHTDDELLAELIEADGRLRISWGKPVELDRYLSAVPDLSDRPEALDAAIDFTLRSLAATGRADTRSVEALVGQYPSFEPAIRDAAALGNAICSTTRLIASVGRPSYRSLPADFGPMMPAGQPRYELRALLGEGAYGQVYLAVDRQLSEHEHEAMVAIKVLTGRDRSDWARQRLIDEATKARRVTHPNVVRVLDRGVSSAGEDFIVYEFVDGGDLSQWLRRTKAPMRPRDAAAMIGKLARGVHAAHVAGLVHCDLKPGNIMLTREGEPKVADFGIAMRSDERLMQAAGGDNGPLGNLAFISPEQFRMEEGALNSTSDVYAIGGLLFLLLTGVLPNGSSIEEIARTHRPLNGRTEPPSPQAACAGIDRDLDAICRRAMATRPEDRHSSAAAVADDLDAWLNREPIPWTRPSWPRIASLWARRKPALAASLAGIFLLVMAAIGATRHLARVAEQQRIEKGIAQGKLENEAAARLFMNERIRSARAEVKAATNAGMFEGLIGQLWVVEWMFGPKVIGKEFVGLDVWSTRVEVFSAEIERCYARGRQADLATLLWEACLAFWLVDEGDYLRAEPLLALNRQKWERILTSDDAWFDHLRGMEACAAINRLADQAQLGALTAAEYRDLRAAHDEILAVLHRLPPEDRRTGMRSLLFEGLGHIYGECLIDDPLRHEYLFREYIRVFEFERSPRLPRAR